MVYFYVQIWMHVGVELSILPQGTALFVLHAIVIGAVEMPRVE